VEFIQLAQNLT